MNIVTDEDVIDVFNHKGLFALESGVILDGFHLAYTTHGELNDEKNNVIWIFHALTANSDAAEWWPGCTEPARRRRSR